MFKKINNAQAISDEDFIVKFNRTYVSYQEKNKAMHIDAEFALEPVRLVIYKESIKKWFKPNEDILIAENDKNIILERVLNALHFLGLKTEVE